MSIYCFCRLNDRTDCLPHWLTYYLCVVCSWICLCCACVTGEGCFFCFSWRLSLYWQAGGRLKVLSRNRLREWDSIVSGRTASIWQSARLVFLYFWQPAPPHFRDAGRVLWWWGRLFLAHRATRIQTTLMHCDTVSSDWTICAKSSDDSLIVWYYSKKWLVIKHDNQGGYVFP